jgi:uridylate kinase
MKLNRILLKLSGEALEGNQGYGIDPGRLLDYTSEIKSIAGKGLQIAIVIGGGNIFRGLEGTDFGVDRVQGDYMGMLATVINSMAIQDELEKAGLKVKHLGGIAIDPICERMTREKAISYLEDGYIVMISGGTGNPYFTTDTASALRAVEIKADAILKGTRVDGVYTADPEKNKKAKKYETLSFDEAYKKNLKIMDLTAFTLCSENNLPIIVFNMNRKGNLLKLVQGKKIGTIVQK